MTKNIKSISDLLATALNPDRKIYEPTKRVKSLGHVKRGYRNQGSVPHHVRHKYPIKNGLSLNDLMVQHLMETNVLLQRLMKVK